MSVGLEVHGGWKRMEVWGLGLVRRKRMELRIEAS
jgi:hypothetical protein